MDCGVIDEKTINALLLQYEYIIKIILTKYKIYPKDYDDFFQEGRIGLLKAICAYADNKGASFASFASICIDRQILSYFRTMGRLKNKPLNKSYPIEALDSIYELNKGCFNNNNIEDDVISRIYYEDVLNHTTKKLDGMDREIFRKYMNGYSVSELSVNYNIPKKQIYVIIARVKKRIAEKINNS